MPKTLIRRCRMDLQLSGRTTLALGGSRGLGQTIAAELVHEGVRLVIVARDADRVARVAGEIGFLRLPGDLAEPGAGRSFWGCSTLCRARWRAKASASTRCCPAIPAPTAWPSWASTMRPWGRKYRPEGWANPRSSRPLPPFLPRGARPTSPVRPSLLMSGFCIRSKGKR
jgi:hypothetical protein